MAIATLAGLAAAIDNATVVGDTTTAVSDIGYDSRSLGEGSLFVALRGGDFDGHRFVNAAIANGAVAVMVEERMPVQVPQIVVAGSSRAALAQVASEFYGHPSRELSVIGITGTDGKTTTSAMLEGILAGTGHQVGAIGTVGIRIGDGTTLDLGHQTTPESVHVQRYLRQMVDSGTRYAVLEATSHGLATHRLDGVRFVAGGVTNITHEHLEFHKTIENYRRAKAILLERVGDRPGVVVINNDDEGARSVRPYATGASVMTYSATGGVADLRAERIDHRGSGVSFDVVVGDATARVDLPMPGQFNVANALCALGLAMGCDIGLRDAATALSNAQPVTGRMQPIDVGQPFRVIVDYAHTPESIRTILSLLRHQYPDGRLIVVTGSAGERDVEKRPLQGRACGELADVTIVTSEDPRNEDPEAINEQIVAGAVDVGAVRGTGVLAITDRREAIQRAFEIAAPGDCVLLAGKGHEASIIWGYEHVPWNEAAVAEALLLEMYPAG
jgi:UDP-N-acetylmuramoyl-L-alanyl-D-glutamate--2,6-diaminopimelate ligase